MPVELEVRDAVSPVLDARRKGLGDFEQGFLRRALAGAVASAGEELREDRARLGQRHAGLDARAPRLAGRGDDAGGTAVALADGDGLVLQLGLAPQPRRQGKERDVEAGEHGARRLSSRGAQRRGIPFIAIPSARKGSLGPAALGMTKRSSRDATPSSSLGARPVPFQSACAATAETTASAATPLTRYGASTKSAAPCERAERSRRSHAASGTNRPRTGEAPGPRRRARTRLRAASPRSRRRPSIFPDAPRAGASDPHPLLRPPADRGARRDPRARPPRRRRSPRRARRSRSRSGRTSAVP